MKLAWPPRMDAGKLPGISPEPTSPLRPEDLAETAPGSAADAGGTYALDRFSQADQSSQQNSARNQAASAFEGRDISPHDLYAEKLLRVYHDGNTRLRWALGLATLAFGLLLMYSSGPVLASIGWFGAILATQGAWVYTSQSLRKKEKQALGGERLNRYAMLAMLEGGVWGALAFFWAQLTPVLQPVLVVVPVLMTLLTVNRYALVPLVLERYLQASLFTLTVGILFANLYQGAWLVLCLGMAWVSMRQEALRLAEDYSRQVRSRFNLEQQVDTDPLTGLLSRRGLDVALNREWVRAERTHSPVSLIMIDIDHFKKFNDRYGHLAGDACVRSVAAVLTSRVDRVGDFTARYSGEVFMVLLHHTAQADARALANRLRQGVLDLQIEHIDNPLGMVSISLGGVTLIPGVKHTPTTILQLLDQALQQAKMQGRNQVAWVTVFD